MLTNFDIDILLGISDHLSLEESQGLHNLLSDALSDKESKKLLQEFQEAVGKWTPPPRFSTILRDFDRRVSDEEATFFVYRKVWERLELLGHLIANKNQARKAWKSWRLTLEEFEEAFD